MLESSSSNLSDKLIVEMVKNTIGGFVPKIVMPPPVNPYSLAIGQRLEDVPKLVAAQYQVFPNPHYLCSLLACEAVAEIKLPELAMRLRRLAVYGILMRDHGLHISACLRVGMLAGGSEEIEDLVAAALSIAAVGHRLERLAAGTLSQPRIVFGGHVAPSICEASEIMAELLQVKLRGIRLARTFSSQRKRNAYGRGSFGGRDFCGYGLDSEKIYEAEVLHGDVHSGYAGGFVGRRCRINKKPILGPSARITNMTVRSSNFMRRQFPFAVHRYGQQDRLLHESVELALVADLSREILQSDCVDMQASKATSKSNQIAIAHIEAPRGRLWHRVSQDKRGRLGSGSTSNPTRDMRSFMEERLRHRCRNCYGKNAEQQAAKDVVELIRLHNPCGYDLNSDFVEFFWR